MARERHAAHFASRAQQARATEKRMTIPRSVTFVRLTLVGTAISSMDGREQFQGEATRVAGSQGTGMANATGSRGDNPECQYTMNPATLGSGQCVPSSGPAFTKHIGG
ncbi:hypothetical protein ACSFBF_24905 [Variovorax sp. ZT5P49]|uniref:hypothetical protein n=1 Tax=Variovorax sp. ZT5P49 TaxID=3443733 RepID=UPI003F455256